MEVYNGRPADCSGREGCEVRTYDLLDELGISYIRVDHEELMTMEGCREIDGLMKAPACKNLFLCNRQKTQFYLLMMPGEKPFKTKDLSHGLGIARLSFAGEEYMEQFLGLRPGSVSVMGLMNDQENRVQLIIDRDVAAQEYVTCHPCRNTSTISLSTKDLLEKFLPAVHHTPVMVDLPDHSGEEAAK